MTSVGDAKDDPSDESVEASTRALRPTGSASGVVAWVLSGSAKGTSRALHDLLRIGKASDNDLVLSDDTVSRHHCELYRAPDGIHVRDLGSTNGTRVHEARVTEATVSPGTVLKVGEVEIVIRASVRGVEILPSDKSQFGEALGR